MTVYLLDANVFIQAKRLHYGFDFCPAFWEWIDRANAAETVFSIDRVGDEIRAGGDDLAAWIGQRPELFLKPDSEVGQSLRSVAQWVARSDYEPAARSTFLQVADYYLVAHAHAYSHVVVTHEVASASPRRIKIPNACIGLQVKCVTPYEMLRLERARFVLGSAGGGLEDSGGG